LLNILRLAYELLIGFKRSCAMQITEAAAHHVELAADDRPFKWEGDSSGVSWAAIIAGAFATAAMYLILLALGTGLGLSAVSPWSEVGASAATVGMAAIVWLIFSEVIASALGGYLTGRLRTKWVLTHSDEVYFRDTANGFLAWAAALLLTVTLLTTAAASMVGHVTQRGSQGTAPIAEFDPTAYSVDQLFRTDNPAATTNDGAAQREASRILTHAMPGAVIAPADRAYLVRLVSAKTGMSAADSEQRVSAVTADAREHEDLARKATAHLLLWIFLTLLIGAFSASYAATIGGRQRDHVRLA
jgi:hypothetical protein